MAGNHRSGYSSAKRALADRFMRALRRDFEQHGEGVIQKLREEQPDVYFNAIVRLMPKEVTFDAEAAVSYAEYLKHIGQTSHKSAEAVEGESDTVRH